MITNLSIIIPARNEADNLPKLISQILQKYDTHLLEIIVVNDCSIDDSEKVIKELQKKSPKIRMVKRKDHPGVGLAIREGIKNISSKSKYVLFMDCDFLVNVPDILKLIQKVSLYDGVVGARFLEKNSLENYPFPKLFANRSYHFIAKTLLGINHTDLTNNFKLYNRKLVENISPLLSSRDFAINAELGYYPLLLGASIGQVPVRWQERKKNMGLSKFKILKVGPSYAKVLLKLILMKWHFV